ncbi:MAG: hypothetical protein V5A23_03140 [Halobacteriales archaeon]
MTVDAELALPDDFEETRFERDAYGPDERSGFAATFASGSTTLSVIPVRYRRRDGHEEVTGLQGDYHAEGETALGGPAGPTTAFALRAEFRPYEVEKAALVWVAAAAGDALAAAVWLARASDDDAALQRHLRAHWGTGPSSPANPAISDDDALGALFADESDRCVLAGKPTSSHRIDVPYRYAPALSGMVTTDHGVVRFPSTAAGLAGVVSHAAWADHGLDAVDFEPRLERAGPGRYVLDPDLIEALSDAAADRFVLRRIGE